MAGLGPWELLIILAIVLLIFGIGRVGKLGSELGRGVSEFRKGINEGRKELDIDEEAEAEVEA